MTKKTSALDRQNKFARRLAVAGGLFQILAALSILVLPVLGGCLESETSQPTCGRYSYLQLGGNLLGYTFLSLMVVVGVLALITSRGTVDRRTYYVRWSGVVLSAIVASVALWSFGIVFVPGAILLWLSALSTRLQSRA
jgi:uncharacterized membrane protein